ncbi:MAG TPA: hypothetical protein VNW68_02485 [Candidatus Limnocylindria bacterium]|nr:hypothetical protein [Candidatus Limnocylindria bacterium]
MPRFQRRPRQGVVYGPVKFAGRPEESDSIVGRLLGGGVVVLALVVLAIGSFTFLGARDPNGPGGTPIAGASPTASPTAVPTPATSPTGPPTPLSTPAPAPSPEPTAEPTPGPTPFELEEAEGPGHITFGTANNSRLRVTDPATTFTANTRITMSADLLRRINSRDGRVHFYRYDPSTGEEELVRDDPVRPEARNAGLFLRWVQPNRELEGPGIYIVRYVRGDEILAEGAFEAVEP